MSEASEYFSLPLVSVIIDNYNLGHSLETPSILFSRRPIRISNALLSMTRRRITVRVFSTRLPPRIQRQSYSPEVNGDQLATCLDGFAASHGDYVCFSIPTMLCWTIVLRRTFSCISRCVRLSALHAAICSRSPRAALFLGDVRPYHQLRAIESCGAASPCRNNSRLGREFGSISSRANLQCGHELPHMAVDIHIRFFLPPRCFEFMGRYSEACANAPFNRWLLWARHQCRHGQRPHR